MVHETRQATYAVPEHLRPRPVGPNDPLTRDEVAQPVENLAELAAQAGMAAAAEVTMADVTPTPSPTKAQIADLEKELAAHRDQVAMLQSELNVVNADKAAEAATSLNREDHLRKVLMRREQ